MKKLVIIIFIAAMFTAAGASAQLPKTINYQGVLTNAGGAVVPDGDYNLTFRLYTVPTGGTSDWDCAETVTVTKGIFNVTLGNTCALTLPFDTQYYLGISVEAEAELAPRTALAACAYSFNSLAVTGTDNIFPATGNVGIGTASPAGKLGIFYDNILSNNAAIKIDNNTLAGQDVISFAFNGLEQASVRKANGGDFYLSSSNGLILRTGSTNKMRVLPGGNVGIGVSVPAELLEVAGGIKLGMSSGTNTGTMRWSGSDFEGYDGGDWVSFTDAGSGSLPSGIAGQTLRHNGSNWLATSFIYNNGTNVGIGTTNPTAPLHLAAANWDLDATEGDFKIGDDTCRLKFGVSTGGLGAGTAGIRVQGGVETLKIGAGSTEVLSIEADGTMKVGSDTQDGIMSVYGNGITNPIAKIYPFSVFGGQMLFYDESGHSTIALQPDAAGEGGYFSVKRSEGSYGFIVDGNYLNENPRVAINGVSNSVVFNMNETENSSVALPTNSISNSEILDEPGGASSGGSTSIDLATEYTTIASQSITTPAAGYVLVIGTTQAQANHTAGIRSWANFGVSSSATSVPANQTTALEWPSALPSSSLYRAPVTVQSIFEVASPGTYTFYFLGYEYYGNFMCLDRQISLIYFPTAYGTVSSSGMIKADTDDIRAISAPITEADVNAQRMESISANNARVQRELTEMRARVEKLERNMENNQ